MRKHFRTTAVFSISLVLLGVAACAPPSNEDDDLTAQETIMWVNHLDLLAGDPSVAISFNAVTSGVGSGLSGLIIESTTLGDNAVIGGNKVSPNLPVPAPLCGKTGLPWKGIYKI